MLQLLSRPFAKIIIAIATAWLLLALLLTVGLAAGGPGPLAEQGLTGAQVALPVSPGSETRQPPARPLSADLDVVKTVQTDSDPANGATVSNGDHITYTITVENTSGGLISISQVEDVLPSGTLFDVQCVVDSPASPGTNCGLQVQEIPVSIPGGGKGGGGGESFVLYVTQAVTWGGFDIAADASVVLQFTAVVDCQPAGAVINNDAGVAYSGGSYQLSNETATSVMLNEASLQEADGVPLIVGPSGCSAEPGGYNQDWGDLDRDGDLDLALATSSQTSVYRNDDGRLVALGSYQRRTFGVRWGDIDGDGGLELISVGDYYTDTTTTGVWRGVNYIFDGGNFNEPSRTFTTPDVLWRIDLADRDLDGDLDMATASYFDPNPGLRAKHNLCLARVYDNDGSGNFSGDECLIGPLTKDTVWHPNSTGNNRTFSVAWGDVGSDGNLDLAAGAYGSYNELYHNPDGFQLNDFGFPIGDTSSPPDSTTSLAWGDYDNNGAPDLAWGNDGGTNKLYRQVGGALETTPIWEGDRSDATRSMAWGDMARPNRDASIPATDDSYLGYNLPFVFNFFGRQIVKISVNTNGLVELLEAGEACRECGAWNTHYYSRHVTQHIDAIFAANDDLMTGVTIESLPEENPDRVEITWMGSTYPRNFTTNPISFKVIMFADGRVMWKFFDMAYPAGEHVFSGLYNSVTNLEYSIGGFVGFPLQPGGTSPQGTNVRRAFLFNGGPISDVSAGWADGNPASIPAADNSHLNYSLPFDFPYFGRTIRSIDINTNGLLELLEAGDTCQACGAPNTHSLPISASIDAVYAFNGDLRTGVIVEYVTDSAAITEDDHLTISWLGTTNADNSFLSRQLTYKVLLFRDGRVRWKFFDLNYIYFASGDRFSGLVDAVGPLQLEIPPDPGGSTAFQGQRVYRKFQFSPAPPAITTYSPKRLFLAVGNYGQSNYLYEPAGAGLTASPVWTSTDSANTTSLAWVDYNRDGNLDLVAGNYDQFIRAYASNGTSLDSNPVNLTVETDTTRSIAWADWNNDGAPDMAVGNDGRPNLVYSNDGAGGMELAWTAPGSDGTQSVAWADADGNGFPDLAAGNDDTYVKLYQNTGGDLDTVPVWTSLYISNTRSVAWGDVDNDGDLDLAVGNDGDRDALYLNRRNFMVLTEKRNLGWVNDLAWGDYNNDGRPDLAIGGVDLEYPGGGFLYIVRNTGAKLMLTDQSVIKVDQGVYAAPGNAAELFDLAWGDYNRDGYLDLAGAFPGALRVKLYKNPAGSGDWSTAQTLYGITAYALDWGDVQSDGWLDLAVGDSPAGAEPTIKIYPNQASSSGTANFLVDTFIAPDANLITGTVTGLRCIDRDNDGDLDLSVVNLRRESQQLTTYGSFLNLTPKPVGTAFAASSVAWGDYNGDGLLDLLLGGNGVSTRLYRNDGTGFSLASPPPTFSSGGRRYAVFGDYTGDGKLDIADGVPGGMVSFYSNGASSSSSSISGVEAYSLGWGDADGDGLLDLLVGGKLSAAGPSYVYINRGSAPFLDASALAWTSPSSERTTSVAWADYDYDNYLDFVVGNCNSDGSDSLQLYHNDGNNTFSLAAGSGLPNGFCVRSVAWADYDGDGDPDLAAGIDGQPSYIYQNQGEFGGTFTPTWSSAVSANTYSVAWGDWNNDGKPDLALGNYGQPSRVYANASTPDATLLLWVWESAQAYNITGLAWGDADGDGDLDLAFSQDSSGQQNGVFENGYASPSHLGSHLAMLQNMPLPRNAPYLHIHRPGTKDAYLISSAALTDSLVPITYTVFDPDGPRNASNPRGDDVVAAITQFEYSLNGGDTWQAATLSGTTTFTGLTRRQGVTGLLTWDAEADGVVGDDVRFRISIVSQKPGGQVQHATMRAVSPPFRLRALSCEWPDNLSIDITVGDTPTDTVAVSQTVKFTSGIGAGSGVLTFTWELGDGSTYIREWTEHVFTATGVYPITLTVIGDPCPVVREAVATAVITVGEALNFANTIYLPIVRNSSSGTAGVSVAVPAPSQVGGLRGRARGGQTTLAWSPSPADETVLGYHVYRTPRPGTGNFELIGSVAADVTTYTDTAAGCGYIYYVTAFNDGGESPPSTASYVGRPCR